MAKREPSATEALARIALGIDLVLVFFGTLVVRGLGRFDEPVVWVVGGVALIVVVVLLRLVRFPAGLWLGHLFHAALLLGFAIDVAIGVSVLVPVGFWVFAIVRGGQLDRLGRASD